MSQLATTSLLLLCLPPALPSDTAAGLLEGGLYAVAESCCEEMPHTHSHQASQNVAPFQIFKVANGNDPLVTTRGEGTVGFVHQLVDSWGGHIKQGDKGEEASWGHQKGGLLFFWKLYDNK